MTTVVYMKDQELPGDALEWRDRNGTLYDFSSGWTFTLKFCLAGTQTVAATKSSGITGAATAPNVAIAWTASDFTSLTAGKTYAYYLYARRAADSLDDVFSPGAPPLISVLAAPA